MAIHKSLITVICICEVIAYICPYAVSPSYHRRRESRPRGVYVIDPNIIQSGYARSYSPPIRETKPANYPVYQKVIEPVHPPYQIYKEYVEPGAPNYQVYQESADQLYHQPVEPRLPNYQVYQQRAEPIHVNYPAYQEIVEPRTAHYQANPKPAEPIPINDPVCLPVGVKPEVQAIAPAVEVLTPILKNDKLSNGHDSSVLNNLAIALQLLIINNLMNNPLPDVSNFDTIQNAIEETRASNNKPCDYPAPMTNAKFLGASNFDDTSSLMGMGNYGSPPTSPRVGSLLKSPYDYLSSASQASEFSSAPATKSNLQSPYAAIVSADYIKDLFAMPDYY